jgi:hypothetical protein
VLSSNLLPLTWIDAARRAEFDATSSAIAFLKSAGYDPAGMLDVLSKLAYEHPAWSKALVADDLLQFRAATESEPPPPSGYVIDRSEFLSMNRELRLAAGLERAAVAPSLLRSKP